MGKSSNQFKVKFNKQGFTKLRKEHAVLDDLDDRAKRIAAEASDNGDVEGYEVTALFLEDPRSAVSVMATGHAARHNAKHHALLRSLDAGRG